MSDSRAIEWRYYVAMTMPFVIDAVITAIYTGIMGLPRLFAINIAMNGVVLLLFGHLGARFLFAPIRRFLATGEDFAGIERRLTQLPLRSANLMMWLSLPILLFRLVGPLALGFTLSGAPLPTWTDSITTVVVQTLFVFVTVYFIVSGYLERLCLVLFERHGVNLGLFFGRFSLKVAVALVFTSLAPLALITAEVLSYKDERLMREVAIDLGGSAFGLAVTLFWISRALTRPLARLKAGMDQLAGGDLALRLPVTSNEEIGEVTAHFNRMVEGLRDRQRLRETFGKYVSESVASQLLQQAGDGRIRGETGTATLLFTDIEGFTSLSERTDPALLIKALNDYLELVLAPIQREGGVVNAFTGDGLFASFNLPLTNPAHAECAIRAALAIEQALEGKVFEGGVRLVTRIGINTGPVIAGTIGAGERLSYTLLGDAVNTASRLQEMNKQHGTRILVSEATRLLAAGRFAFRPIGAAAIRGKAEPLLLHTVVPH